LDALGKIHAQPEIAVPAVMTYLTKSPYQSSAAMVLGRFGTNAAPAVPLLLEMLAKDRDPMARGQAAGALGKIRVEPASVLPALVQSLKDTTPYIRDLSAGAIVSYGAEARPIVPTLVELLKGPDTLLRSTVATTLGRIHVDPELVVPALLEYLVEPKGNHMSAAQALAAFGADAKPAVPALVELLNSPNADYRRSAAEALKQIDPEAAAKAGVK